MPKKTPIINDFRAGELTPITDVRVDLKDYYRGCRILENAMPIIEGGVARVPGTYYVRPVKQTEEGWCLRVTKSGSGTGTVVSDLSPGINCGSSCYYFFLAGSTVNLTATPDANSSFVGWSGDGTGAVTRSLTMNGNKTVDAEFSAFPQWANLIGWYKVNEGTGTVIANSAPAGANKFPDLAIVASNADFWTAEPGFGYWKIAPTVTQVYATFDAMTPFPTAAGTVIYFAKEGFGGVIDKNPYLYQFHGAWSSFKNHPIFAITMHRGGTTGTPTINAVTFTPRRYATNFAVVLTHDAALNSGIRVKYVGDADWTTDTGSETGYDLVVPVELYLGRPAEGTDLANNTFVGLIGDLMIWNVLLTDAEINTVVTQRGARWGI